MVPPDPQSSISVAPIASATIAFVALLVSISTLLLTNFRAKHRLLMVVDFFRPVKSSAMNFWGQEFHFNAFLINDGNRSAVVIRTSLFVEAGNGRVQTPPKETAVLKAGEAVVLDLRTPSDHLTQILRYNGKPARFGVAVDLVEPSGVVAHRRIEIGQIDFVPGTEERTAHFAIGFDGEAERYFLIDEDNLRRPIAALARWWGRIRQRA